MAVDKEQPTDGWIQELRARFPCEPEIDHILTRKLERRREPGYAPQSLAGLVAATEHLIRTQYDSAFTISNARWLAGGASKLQVAFDIDWDHPERGREVTQMVLRMEPAASIVETSRRREFEIIKALRTHVPVPEVFWMDEEGTHLPYPAIIYAFVDGVTKPSDAASQASGIGTVVAPRWRASLGPAFAKTLAQIHCAPVDPSALTAFEVPAPGTAAIERSLNHWERVWEEDAEEDIPLLRLACAWLRANMPACENPAIVHGDYRVGNFLFTEHDARITAVLDWEMARIADPHFDLAWASTPAFGGMDDDGSTHLVGGFQPEVEFLETWEQAADRFVDQRSFYYYKVFCGWVQGVIALATCARVSRYGRTHQDALVAWMIGVGPKLLADLRDLLEQGG